MKKQYFIFLTVACMLSIFNIKAQNTPIDDFLKKYTSREGVTNVAMSQQMLQSIFAPSEDSKAMSVPSEDSKSMPAPSEDSKSVSAKPNRVATTEINGMKMNKSNDGNFVWFSSSSSQNLNVPEAYSSVSISKTDIPENLFTNFKKTLLSSKYEQFMEVNKENSNILGYYLKKVKDNSNEIVVLRQQKDQFSAIYIKGDIDINQVDRYLVRIRSALARMGATNHKDMFQPDLQLALAMPVLDDLKLAMPMLDDFSIDFHDFKFDNDALKLRMEESMKEMKNWEFKYNEDMQQNIQDVMENAKKLAEDAHQQAMEEAQKRMEEKQMEDAAKQAEEEQTENL